MATCGGCGAYTTRLTMTMTSNGGRTLVPDGQRREVCPGCAPDVFSDPWADPSDRRIWPEHIARPHLYTTMPDGSLRAKDSVLCEIQDAMDADPDAEAMQSAIAKKRANRRTEPLTQAEIDAADKVWRPIVKQRLADLEEQDKQDRLYTEAIIEKHVRNSATIH